MSLKIVLALVSTASLISLALGYYLRLIISLGKKGSMELDIKQMMLQAQTREKVIIDEADKKAEEIFEKSGRKPGNDLQNWLDAEKIVKGKFSK